MADDLCAFERDVIRCCAGLPQNSITGWGAALGAAVDNLHAQRMLRREMRNGALTYVPTEAGLAAITGEG